MAKARRLSRKQLSLIEDLFAGDLDEQQLLDKHRVSVQLYRKWLADGQFNDELNHRVDRAYRQSKLLLASNAPAAAKELVGLTKSKSPETARKACLDIMAMNPSAGLPGTSAPRGDETGESTPISPQAASRVLAALADDEGEQQTSSHFQA